MNVEGRINNRELRPGTHVPTQLYIDGRWQAARDDATFAVEDPATGSTLAWVADAGVSDASDAVAAAVAAQQSWSVTAPRARADILSRAYGRLIDRREDFAALITAEMGKPLDQARSEVDYAADFLRWFSEEAARLDGTVGRAPDGRTRVIVTRRPVGPCLLITPWNFPLAMATRKIGPALAAGCSVVLKPAPETPLASLALAEVFAEAGLPAGVLNVIPSSRAEYIVPAMLGTGGLRKLSFTGSTEVGRLLLTQAAEHVMRTSMELGGNAPFIVFDDADLDVAVEAAMCAKMRNMGEACTAANRIYAQAGIEREFTARLASRVAAMKVADGRSAGADLGPVINRSSLTRLESLLQDAIERGAEVLAQTEVPESAGYFFPATMLSNVDPGSALFRTEAFGPIAGVAAFADEEEAIRLANDSDAGLVAYVMTCDLQRAFRVGEALDVGMVGLNTGIVSNAAAPFGGTKHSGLGREGGRVGIDDYLEYQYLAIPIG